MENTVQMYENVISVKDKKLDEGKTNANGEFRLSGSKREVSTIDPKVNIYHKCNYTGESVFSLYSHADCYIFLSSFSFVILFYTDIHTCIS